MKREPLRVLLIEDSDVYRRLIQSQLESAGSGGIVLEPAECLRAGLRLLGEKPFDAVLLDLVLPDSSGIDTLWRTLAQFPDIAIVVLTALDDEELAVKAVKGGAQDYLGKELVTGENLVRSLRYAIERKNLVTQVKKTVADLEQNNQDVQQFAGAVAKIFPPLLESISETCQLLLEDQSSRLDEKARTQMSSALDEAVKLGQLVENFLTYIRVALHKPASGAEADCEAVLTEVLDNLQEEIVSSEAKVTHEPLPVVPGERSLIMLLFENLIGNAIKYRGEQPPEFHVGVEREADKWVFKVQDNGLGIDAEYPEQIFDLFALVSDSGEKAGRGIGLAICRRIIENQGGEIWVESELGKGSVFYFTLPARSESV